MVLGEQGVALAAEADFRKLSPDVGTGSVGVKLDQTPDLALGLRAPETL